MYDITDRNSFVRVQNWVKELRKMLGKDIELAIVGNKIDLEANRVVTVDEAEKYVKFKLPSTKSKSRPHSLCQRELIVASVDTLQVLELNTITHQPSWIKALQNCFWI